MMFGQVEDSAKFLRCCSVNSIPKKSSHCFGRYLILQRTGSTSYTYVFSLMKHYNLVRFWIFENNNRKRKSLKRRISGALFAICTNGRPVHEMPDSLEKDLEHMFREDLMVACQYWGIDVSGTRSGTQLTELLAERMRDKENRLRIFATFTQLEYDLLGMLTLNGGAMSYDRLKPYRKIYSYGQLNQTERDLRKKGIIIRRMMSRLTEYGREVAEFKIMDFFIPHLTEYFSKKPEPNPEKPKNIRDMKNERDSLLIDILLLISYLEKHEVRMTTSWEFPKREIEHIKEPMSDPSEERFETVQKIARKAGAYQIVDEDRVIPGNIVKLFGGDQKEVTKKLLLSALGRTRAIWATPDQPTEYTLNLVICRLRECLKDEWIRVDEMKGWIRSELFQDSQPLKWIQVDDDRVAIALETPILLGLVEGAYKKKKLVAVKLTDIGEEVLAKKKSEKIQGRDTFIVQPNFELTVFTTEMDYSKLYKLLLLTEPVKTDVVSTFRITDQSIFQAIEAGLRENEIIEFLEKESSKPVPGNVLRSIKDWTSQTTFAKISDVTLFETETERELEDLLLLKDFKKYFIRQVGPTAAIVSGDMEELSETMKEHKCKIKITGREETHISTSQDSSIAEKILLYGDSTDTTVPEACLGCPAVNSCNRVLRRRKEEKQKA
ncbi:MAG: hypothetical protein GF411_10365 [Candidatus Lokiarchaeota archaeon]|nr:hypothetical protein [Candidatus Lokiarchaeota archaeon]